MHRQSKIRRRYKRYSHYLNKQKEFLLNQASLKLTVFRFDIEQSRRWHALAYEVFGSDDNFDLLHDFLHEEIVGR